MPKLDANRYEYKILVYEIQSGWPTQRAHARHNHSAFTRQIDLIYRLVLKDANGKLMNRDRIECFVYSLAQPMMAVSAMALRLMEDGGVCAAKVCCWRGRCRRHTSRREPRSRRGVIIAPTHPQQETSAMCHFQLNAVSFAQTRKSMFPPICS